MMFGVGTSSSRLHVDAFIHLLGEDDQGWGLSHKGTAWHDGKVTNFTEPFKENVATTVGIYFDGVQGTLRYFKVRLKESCTERATMDGSGYIF